MLGWVDDRIVQLCEQQYFRYSSTCIKQKYCHSLSLLYSSSYDTWTIFNRNELHIVMFYFEIK